jgi:hypothetical protein
MTLSTLGGGGGVVKAGRKYSDPPFVEREMALRLCGRFKGATKFEVGELAGLECTGMWILQIFAGVN